MSTPQVSAARARREGTQNAPRGSASSMWAAKNGADGKVLALPKGDGVHIESRTRIRCIGLLTNTRLTRKRETCLTRRGRWSEI